MCIDRCPVILITMTAIASKDAHFTPKALCLHATYGLDKLNDHTPNNAKH